MPYSKREWVVLKVIKSVVAFWIIISFSWVDATEEIDILVLYTADAAEYTAGGDGMEALVLGGIVDTNLAFENSDIALALRLRGLREVDYAESQENLEEDLDALSFSNGPFSQVDEWRQEVGADLVCLFRKGNVEGSSGIAWLLDRESGDSSLAFSVVNTEQLLSSLLLQHEIGHNLGADHDRENSTGGGLFSYSHGHRFESSEGGSRSNRTVMAYSPGLLINYFSNPEMEFRGAPTGVSEEEEGSADNARTIRQTAAVVAEYRTEVFLPPEADAGPNLTLEDLDGDLKEIVRLFAWNSKSWDADLTYVWSWEGQKVEGVEVAFELALGTYEIKLEVTDSLGLKSSDTVSVSVLTPSRIVGMEAGWRNSFLITENGAVRGSGENAFGELGSGDEEVARSIDSLLGSGVRDVSSNSEHSLYLLEDGSVWATGRNQFGQFGNGERYQKQVPTKILGGGVKSIATGDTFSLILKTDGTLWVAGNGDALGLEVKNGRTVSLKKMADSVVDVAASVDSAAFVKENGSVWLVGGILRQIQKFESVPNLYTPYRIIESGAIGVDCSIDHGVALMNDGSVYTFGSYGFGELGVYPKGNETGGVFKVLNEGAAKVFASRECTFILKNDGSLWACGLNRNNWFGPLYNKSRYYEFVQLVSSHVVDFSVGWRHMLFLRDDGSVWGIGSNEEGQLGLGEDMRAERLTQLSDAWEPTENEAPVANAGPNLRIEDLDGDGAQVVYLKGDESYDDWSVDSWKWKTKDGTVLSENGIRHFESFELGRHELLLEVTDSEGLTSEDQLIVEVISSTGVKSVESIEGRSFVIMESGALWVSGYGPLGELGTLEFLERFESGEPRQLLSGGVAEVIAGSSHTLFRMEDGSLWAAGSSYAGQLGNGTVLSSSELYRVAEEGVVSVAVGESHSAFVMENGSVWGMGRNGDGQLVLGGEYEYFNPVMIWNSGASKVFAEDDATFLLLEDGTLRGSGRYSYGAGFQNVLLSEVKSAVIGPSFYGALKTDGSLWAMSRGLQSIRYLYKNTEPAGTFVRVHDGPFDSVVTNGATFFAIDDQGGVLAWESLLYGLIWGSERELPTKLIQRGVVAASLSEDFGLILREDGSLWGIGSFLEKSDFGNIDHEYNHPTQIIAGSGERINDSPIADAGRDISICDISGNGVAPVILDGSASFDDWAIESWFWNWDEGSAEGERAVVNLPVGETVVQLTVLDSDGVESVDTVSVTIESQEKVIQAGLGMGDVLVLTEKGGLYAAGSSGAFPFGIRKNPPSVKLEGAALFEADVSQFSGCDTHVLAVKKDGSLWGYGTSRDGQLGLGNNKPTVMPRSLMSGGVVKAFAAEGYSLVIKSDGSLWTAGLNSSGQLGRGTQYRELEFGQVVDSGVVEIAGNERTAFFVKSDGSLWQMGERMIRSESGVEGGEASVPERVVDSGVARISVGLGHLLVQKVDQSLWGGGNNNSYQIAQHEAREYRELSRIDIEGVVDFEARFGRSMFVLDTGALYGIGSSSSLYSDPYSFGFYVSSRLQSLSLLSSSKVKSIFDGIAIMTDDSVWQIGKHDVEQFGLKESPYSNVDYWTLLIVGPEPDMDAPPAAWAGRDFAVYSDTLSEIIRLDGSGSWDDRRIVSWHWDSDRGFSDYGEKASLYVFPGKNEFTLTVRDNQSYKSTDVVRVFFESKIEFLEWLALHFTADEISDMLDPVSADSDGDGISNGEEKRLGLDPTSFDLNARLSVYRDGMESYLLIEGAREQVRFKLLGSSNLVDWMTMSLEEERIREDLFRYRFENSEKRFFYKIEGSPISEE